MKILRFILALNAFSWKKPEQKLHTLVINNNEVEQIKVYSHSLHSKTYKLLRTFATPQYNDIYVFRNKKGFNTYFFQQHYDVFVTDSRGNVINIYQDIPEGFISSYHQNGYYIYFATVGTINQLGIKVRTSVRIKGSINNYFVLAN